MTRRHLLGGALIGFVLSSSVMCKRAAAPAPPPATVAAAHADAAPAAVKLCEHRVPADLCTQCNPDLEAVFKDQGDWCDEHGVPESQCLKCNPNLQFTAASTEPRDWCKEHAVPESMCTKCNPKLVAKYVEAGDYCREHGYPQSVCPICNPEKVTAAGAQPPAFPEPGTRIRLASPQTAGEAGIETTTTAVRPFARTLEVVGQIQFEPNRHAQLSARADSLVLQVHVSVGDEVKAGQPLVALSSSSVGSDQARLAAARTRVETAAAALEREKSLAERRISARKDVEDAQREAASAKADQDAALAALRAAGATPAGSGGRYVLTAPFAGTVVARDAAAGQTAAAGQKIVELADLSAVSAELDIPEADAGSVRIGQRVQVTVEGSRSGVREGTISAIGAMVDPQSRTVRARVALRNADRTLRSGLFVRARIQIGEGSAALLVPRAAVQYAQGRALVFIKRDDLVYDPVAVTVGAEDGDQVEIVSGLSAGVQVVTTGAFLLKTEILKESIGAGCCEEEGGS